MFTPWTMFRRHTGLALVNQNVYWTAIGNLVGVLAYHWSFVGTIMSFLFIVRYPYIYYPLESILCFLRLHSPHVALFVCIYSFTSIVWKGRLWRECKNCHLFSLCILYTTNTNAHPFPSFFIYTLFTLNTSELL